MPSLLWGFDLFASIRDCRAAYASSACFAHASHRAAIWLHVAFSFPRLELAMRPHSAAWRRNSSDGFIAYLVEAARPQNKSSKVAPRFRRSANKDMLRRSDEALRQLGLAMTGIFGARGVGCKVRRSGERRNCKPRGAKRAPAGAGFAKWHVIFQAPDLQSEQGAAEWC